MKKCWKHELFPKFREKPKKNLRDGFVSDES